MAFLSGDKEKTRHRLSRLINVFTLLVVCSAGAWQATQAHAITVNGHVYEDINGDADPSDFTGIGRVVIASFKDDGNGVPDSNDTSLARVTTASNGSYSISFNPANPAGTYWIVVDSRTIAPDAGIRAGHSADEVWAEQTYGPQNALCANPDNLLGSGDPFVRSNAGPCYGGRRGNRSDTFDNQVPSTIANAEHVMRVVVANNGNTTIDNADFAFSFTVVTNTNDQDDDNSAHRTAQGSLRQFVQNANAITGANAMRFVPVVSTNRNDGANSWWHITLSVGELPRITDRNSTVDGRAYSYAVSTDIRNTNSLVFTPPGPVGVSETPLADFEGPELEINVNDRGNGFYISASDVIIQHLSIYNSRYTWVAAIYVNRVRRQSGNLIKDNFIGIRANGRDPGGNKRGLMGIFTSRQAQVDVDHNYIGHMMNSGIWFRGEGEIRKNWMTHFGIANSCGDAISLEDAKYQRDRNDVIIRENYIHNIAAYGVETWRDGGGYTIENNLIAHTGMGNQNGTYCTRTINDINISERGGIRLFGDGSLVKGNVLFDIGGHGVAVVARATGSPAQQNHITQNHFFNNGGISIDLDQTHTDGGHGPDNPNGDGVTPNDGDSDSAQQNNGLDYPVINSAQLTGGTLAVRGYIGTPASTAYDGQQITVEIYRADDDGNNNGKIHESDPSTVRVPHGEGHWYLDACTVTPAANGQFTCSISVPGAVSLSPGDHVTATATDSNENTSEFGPNRIVHGLSPFAGTVVLNEILYRGTANTTAGNDEFIELYNNGNNPVDLSGWRLGDGDLLAVTEDGVHFTFPNGTTLQPDEYAVIWVGRQGQATNAPDAAYQAWLNRSPALNNRGDDLELFDANNGLVDYMAYGTGSAVDPPPISGIWDASRQNNLAGASTGQSISLTPNGLDGNSADCWELTTSGDAQNYCTGYLPTVDRDTYGNRITSVSRKNNNDLPDAVDDTLVVQEDSLNNSFNVLGNDNFGGDGPATGTITITTMPGHGTATVDTNGTPTDPTDDRITYTPTANYHGADTLVYRICDSDNDCDTATVAITVTSVNDLPVAQDDANTVKSGEVLDVDASQGLLANDTDPDGDVLCVTRFEINGTIYTVHPNSGGNASIANIGELTINCDGSYTFQPDTIFHDAVLTVHYTIDDGHGGMASAQLSITIEKKFPWHLFIPAILANRPNPEYCHMVADRDNEGSMDAPLLKYTFATDKYELINRLGAANVESIVLSLDGSTLYGADNGVLGIIDTRSGRTNSFTPLDPSASDAGYGRGAQGLVRIWNIDGLAFDPTDGTLYGTHRLGEGSDGQLDLLVKLNPATGRIIPNAFGSGVDYVVIDSASVGSSDVDDIGIDTSGNMVAVAGNSSGGGNDHLIGIDKRTGRVTDMGPLYSQENNRPIQDMEGLCFFNQSILLGTTGVAFANETSNTLYVINKNSVTGKPILKLNQNFNGYVPSDVEAITCSPERR